MNITFEIIVLIVCMIAYTIYAIWQMTKFKKTSTGIAGAACLTVGSVGVYFAVPFIATFITGLLNFILIIGIMSVIGAIFD